jgi:hypothetical protein
MMRADDKRLHGAWLGGIAWASLSASTIAPAADTALTIYSSAVPGAIPAEFYRPVPGAEGLGGGQNVPGFAIVRDERELTLPSGRSVQRFVDVAAYIDPTTVNFVSLTDPGTRVLEQSYQFDLVSAQKLLQKHVGRNVTVERNGTGVGSTVSGTLLSASDGLVLRANDGSITTLKDYATARFAELPGGLITRPTLEWSLNSPRGGKQRTRVSYETGGVTWWADYNLVFNPGKDANSGQLDVSAWVSILNMSGASFQNTRLKLVAGDVQRNQSVTLRRSVRAEAVAMADSAPGFTEKAFSEFHLYTLGRPADLPDNSTRQLELFEQVRQVPARKQLIYRGAESFFGGPILDREVGVSGTGKVDVYLEFRNDRAAGLGVPLPAGRIRVSQLDTADGSLEFIGEDRLDHTPKDERVRIKLGSAFDVVGERKQVDFAIDTRARWLEEEVELRVRNRKSEAVEVSVVEGLYRTANWKMLTRSQEYTRQDARTVVFPLKIASDAEAVVRYRVRYSW